MKRVASPSVRSLVRSLLPPPFAGTGHFFEDALTGFPSATITFRLFGSSRQGPPRAALDEEEIRLSVV
ncbi:hypothetical protein CHH27_18010 [Labrenzia sp. VG12]|nr:hypothetical protein CHH27_18010 [Labrenzia sp. VG12]